MFLSNYVGLVLDQQSIGKEKDQYHEKLYTKVSYRERDPERELATNS